MDSFYGIMKILVWQSIEFMRKEWLVMKLKIWDQYAKSLEYHLKYYRQWEDIEVF